MFKNAFLPPASEGWGKVIVSVCVSVHTSIGGGGGGTYLPRSEWGDLPSQAGEYLPSQVWTGGIPTFPGRGGGLPTLARGYLDRGYLPWPGGAYLGWGIPTLAGGGTYLGWGGYLPWQGGTLWGGGVPTFPCRNSIACACYAAGGMPLAFTQEDFLVICKISDQF